MPLPLEKLNLMKALNVIVVFLFLLVGCRTGGSRINTSSSGILSVTTPSNLVRQPNGIYKLEPAKLVTKVEPAKSTVKVEPVKPTLKPSVPVEVKNPPPIIKPPVEKYPPIKPKALTPNQEGETLPSFPSNPSSLPSLETATPAPLETAPANLKLKAFPTHWGEPPAIQTKDLVPLPGGYGEGSGTLAHWIQEKLDKDKSSNKGASILIKWSELISFYAVCVTLILVSWLSYALYKDWHRVKSLKDNSKPKT